MPIKYKRLLVKLFSVLFWIGVWAAAAAAISREALLPSPFTVFKRFFAHASEADFYYIALFTMLRILSGFAAAIVLGAVLAYFNFKSMIFQSIFEIPLKIIKSTPVASFIILLLVWLDVDIIPSVTAFLIVLPVICDNLTSGLSSTDKQLEEIAFLYKFSAVKKLKYLYIPSVKSYFEAAVASSFGMAWKAGVAAEVLCTPKNSIGKMLYESKIYLESADLFAWTILLIILSMAIEKIISFKKGGINKNAKS